MEHQHPLFSFEDFSFSYPLGNTGTSRNKEISGSRGVSLQGTHSIAQNNTILLTGDSGSGKSTLLYGLKGLIPTTIRGSQSGSIYYKGTNMHDLTPTMQQEIGIVFQNPNAQILTSTVWRELALGLENMAYTPQEMHARITDYAKRCAISHLLSRNTQTLSGGEKQKVALVSILAMEPAVILLDEPTAFLDPLSAQEFTDFFRNYRKKKTIVVVEHNIAYLKNHIDEFWYMQSTSSHKTQSTSMQSASVQSASVQSASVQSASVQSPPLQSTIVKAPFSDFVIPPSLSSSYHTAPSPPHSEIVLKVEHVAHRYHKDHTLLQDIDFSAKKGEIVGIEGNNGAGKSTLLNIIAGLISPQEGRVLLHHKDIRHMARKDIYTELAYVFQNPDLHFLYNTVKEELAGDMSILEDIGLKIEEERNPFTLSEGEKRRLSLAIMWQLRRRLYLLDEPTFGQDYGNRKKLCSLIRTMGEEGNTIIIVSHDRDFLEAVSHTIMTLQEGRMHYA